MRPSVQAREVGKRVMPGWRVVGGRGLCLAVGLVGGGWECWMWGKSRRGGVVGVDADGWDGGGVVVGSMSRACHAEGSDDEGWVERVMVAGSVRVVAQRVEEAVMRDWRSVVRSAASRGAVNGRRIFRMLWTVDSMRVLAGMESGRVLMARRVRTRQMPSLRASEAEREAEIEERKGLRVWLFAARPFWGEKGCQMVAQRQEEMMCSTLRIRR